MKRLLLLTAILVSLASCNSQPTLKVYPPTPEILPGATDLEAYLPLLEGKRVAILSNQTGLVSGNRHVLDTLLALNVNVVSIFSPEHGFRGTADAGELVGNSVDGPTGVPISSLYDGKGGYPSDEAISEFDVLIFDLQDVGVRFYTYNVTMGKMMYVCAKHDKKMIVLDRPNPIGFMVDGPILDLKYKSGVGWYPIPVCHGMTLGELALMINGEGWLPEHVKCDLTVVKCRNYTHQSRYVLPVKPSPNLPNMRSIYLYPTLCYFEATPVSLGRGTDFPFQMYGHPNMKGYNYSFTPRSVEGAKEPPQLDQLCYGVDLRERPSDDEVIAAGINLEYIIDAYKNLHLGSHFFRSFFELLIGRDYVRRMIMEGATADEIRAMWTNDIIFFKEQRKPYLLYEE